MAGCGLPTVGCGLWVEAGRYDSAWLEHNSRAASLAATARCVVPVPTPTLWAIGVHVMVCMLCTPSKCPIAMADMHGARVPA